ncbi:MAG TPA: acyl-CoA dehydrogenase family protein [Anaeromyxobacteraceae bacterium]|nr:acyl-CoA dehydrogenase family protein [Anaeromyxobacteraceae bacterium]
MAASAFEPFGEYHEAFRRTVRAFVEKELAPHAREWDEAGAFPRELYRRFGELGLFGIHYDPALGGSGQDYWHVVVYAEELARSTHGGLNTAMLVHGEMATPVIAELGTGAQQAEFLAPAIRGERIAALAVTEPDAGSDVAAIRTTARRDGGDLVVNGSKAFITNGDRADFLTLAVRTGGPGWGGLSLLLFPTDVKGFQVSRKLDTIGNRGSGTSVLYFEDCRVPARYLLGEENQGFQHILANFQGERLVAAVHAVAGMRLLVEEAIRYGGERQAFGRPITGFQVWRHKLAEHLAAIEAARWLAYRAVALHDRREPAVREISMAKLVACELAQRVAYDCLQLHGGMGYVEESAVARAWRDLRALTIAGGTSEVMKELIAKCEGL